VPVSTSQRKLWGISDRLAAAWARANSLERKLRRAGSCGNASSGWVGIGATACGAASVGAGAEEGASAEVEGGPAGASARAGAAGPGALAEERSSLEAGASAEAEGTPAGAGAAGAGTALGGPPRLELVQAQTGLERWVVEAPSASAPKLSCACQSAARLSWSWAACDARMARGEIRGGR
jgi:hypothetical protein